MTRFIKYHPHPVISTPGCRAYPCPDNRGFLRTVAKGLALLLLLLLPLGADLRPAWGQAAQENEGGAGSDTTATPVPAGTDAQEAEGEPLFDELTRRFKTEPLSIGLVAQAVADVIFDRSTGHNGFSVGAARLNVRGTLDYGFSYFVQSEFRSNPVLLDARVSYAFSPAFVVDAGLFKAPFSAEFLISAPSIDFVNRSQVVSALAPGRQVGLGIRGRIAGGMLGYQAGLFNGNGRQLGGNDNNELMYVGRLTLRPTWPSGSLELGGSVAYSKDDLPAFTGSRTLFGGDFRLTLPPLLLSGEALYATLDAEMDLDRQPFGYQGTVGFMIVPERHQLLVRWDAYELDDNMSDTRNVVVVGYNFWPSSPFQIQVNYLVPVEDTDFGNHQVLINFQVAF